jgi:hypothetical protein
MELWRALVACTMGDPGRRDNFLGGALLLVVFLCLIFGEARLESSQSIIAQRRAMFVG